MLKCALMILRIIGIENRKSSVRARIVVRGFKEQAGLGQAPGWGDVDRERAGPEKAILEGSYVPGVPVRENYVTCFVAVDIIIRNVNQNSLLTR